MRFSLGMLCFTILLGSCLRPPDYDDVPVIEFLSMSSQTLTGEIINPPTGWIADTLAVTITFEDGDGDLGLADDIVGNNVTFTDSRDGFEFFFKTPQIPPQGVGSGISGEMTFKVLTVACLGSSNETITYDIRIRDRAGNESNTITTPIISLQCQ